MAVPAVFALAVLAIGVLALVVVANRRRDSRVNHAHAQSSGDSSYPTMFMGDSGSSGDCADGSAADGGGCDGGGGDGGGGGGGGD